MADSKTPPTVLFLSGSLRRQSNNTAIMNSIIEKLGDRVNARRFDIASLPFYNADLDTPEPLEPVRALKQAIADADGLVIVTPEYNYSIPGVLKNAIDWASRPGYKSVFRDKPVFIATSSGGAMGGVRVQAHLKYVLIGMLARPFNWQEIIVPAAGEKIKDGKLVHEPTETFIMEAMDAFLKSL